LNFAERFFDWKKLKYMRYNAFLKALDSSGRVREMIQQPHTAQQRKTQAMKNLGDFWQHYPKRQEFLTDSSGGKKCVKLTAIAN
jgi:hypothetical protein